MIINIQLIIAILCTFMGFVVGAGVGMLIAGRTKKQPEINPAPIVPVQDSSPEPVPVSTPAPEPTPVQIPLEMPAPTPIPVLQPTPQIIQGVLLTQNAETGKLSVVWDGKTVPEIDYLTADQLQKLRKIGREWFVWLSDKKQPAKPSPIREILQSDETAPALEISRAQEKMDEPIQNRLISVVSQVSNGAKPPIGTENLVTSGLEGAAAVPPAKPLSMVGQIDEILQTMLKEPSMKNRGIKLVEDPRRGVVVWVGLDQYVGIDSVADQEVKNIIRAAVAEWERRNEKK